MQTPRLRSAWQGGPVLFGLLLWSLLSAPATSQERPGQRQAPPVAGAVAPQRIASSIGGAIQMVAQQGAAAARLQMAPALRLDSAGALEVYLYTTALTPTQLASLRQYGVQVHQSNAQFGMVYASVPTEMLERLTALPFVRWIGPPSYSALRTGSVTSEGDAVMRADLVRANLGVTGRGVRVGIISDSLRDLATSVNSGDLPADLLIVNGADGGNVPLANDEGRAMAEIVHDLAPGASLLFRSGFPTSLDFIAAVQELTAAGAHVIVDDVGIFNEPFFEDGPVAQAVRQAITQGVVYVTATGNDARTHYQGTYTEFNAADGDALVNLHDFGGGDTRLDVRIAPDTRLAIFLQWPDPFNGSANTADYDLLLVDDAGNTLTISNDRQLSTPAPPAESVEFFNATGRTLLAGLVINRVAGPALPLALYMRVLSGSAVFLEHRTATMSVFGHPCVREAIAVGAVDANEPAFDTLEGFSSQGPCTAFFPGPEVRTKPDVAAADGVMTSLPTFTPFFGTSAAAPHVAAVAALLIEASGGPGAVSNTRIADTLRLAAVDRGVAGVDNSFGHGVVDALLAVQTIQSGTNLPPRSVIDAPGADLTVPPGASLTVAGHCVDAEGDQPVTVVWDFGSVAAPATVLNPAPLTFPTLGVFPIMLTCTDATGRVDPRPARRTITVNNPPESRIVSPAAEVSLSAGNSLGFASACSDPDNNGPFTVLWNFGGSASPASSTEPSPSAVVFNTPGTFTVSLTCADALGTLDPSPAIVRVTVTAAPALSAAGGGGGCTLRPGRQSGAASPLEAVGGLLLPVLVLGLLRAWRWWRARHHACGVQSGNTCCDADLA